MTDQYRLTVLSKQHQISFPVTRLAPLMDIGRAPIDSHTSLDAIYQAAAFASTPTALAFGTRQVVSPAIVLGATDLRIDKPIDRFIADAILRIVCPAWLYRAIVQRCSNESCSYFCPIATPYTKGVALRL